MDVKKGYRMTRNEWHYFHNDSCAVYVDDNGMITRAVKRDCNRQEVSAAVYKSDGNGGYNNIMPCTRAEFRKKGVIIL